MNEHSLPPFLRQALATTLTTDEKEFDAFVRRLTTSESSAFLEPWCDIEKIHVAYAEYLHAEDVGRTVASIYFLFFRNSFTGYKRSLRYDELLHREQRENEKLETIKKHVEQIKNELRGSTVFSLRDFANQTYRQFTSAEEAVTSELDQTRSVRERIERYRPSKHRTRQYLWLQNYLLYHFQTLYKEFSRFQIPMRAIAMIVNLAYERQENELIQPSSVARYYRRQIAQRK